MAKQDLTGKRIQNLTVISYNGIKNGNRSWLCKCDCGNEVIRSTSYLNTNKATSCGCEHSSRISNRMLKNISASFNSLYLSYKHKANDRKLPFELTKDEFFILVKKNCHYCGVEPRQIKRTQTKYINEPFIYNGIDRINNSIGYDINNCVSCCGVCNQAKHTMTQKEFYDWIDRLIKFNSGVKNEDI